MYTSRISPVCRYELSLGLFPFSEENVKSLLSLAINQLLSFFCRMTILLKMWFSASDKMVDVSVGNRIVYFVNAHGINFFSFFLPSPIENILPSAVFISLNELSKSIFWQKSHCNLNWSESLSISEACMGMNNTESCLAQFQHFFTISVSWHLFS